MYCGLGQDMKRGKRFMKFLVFFKHSKIQHRQTTLMDNFSGTLFFAVMICDFCFASVSPAKWHRRQLLFVCFKKICHHGVLVCVSQQERHQEQKDQLQSNQSQKQNRTKNLNQKWFQEKWYFGPFDYYSLIILQLQTLQVVHVMLPREICVLCRRLDFAGYLISHRFFLVFFTRVLLLPSNFCEIHGCDQPGRFRHRKPLKKKRFNTRPEKQIHSPSELWLRLGRPGSS